jgi:hypothetical protein
MSRVAMPFSYDEFDLSDVRTYPLTSRASKVQHTDFARPWQPDTGFAGWLDALPRILAAGDLRAIVSALRSARDAGGIVWGLGAHVIKTGLAPVLIDLMERGFVSAVALNGAGVIHDFKSRSADRRPRMSTRSSAKASSGWPTRPVAT